MGRYLIVRTLFLCVLAALSYPFLAHGQTPSQDDPTARRTVAATRLEIEESIVLDGRLDEAVWQRALPAADFIQIDPANVKPATEPTEVRIAFDRDTFYMG